MDATNAFNLLNREGMVATVARLVPELAGLVEGMCEGATPLFAAGGRGDGGGLRILGREGVAQGCPLSMALYAVGMRPLVELGVKCAGAVRQAWYADDARRTLVRYDNGDLVFELESID